MTNSVNYASLEDLLADFSDEHVIADEHESEDQAKDSQVESGGDG